MMQSITDKLQRLSREWRYALGTEQSLYHTKNPRDVVVMYHNVLPEEIPSINIRNISVENFRRHLQYFKKRYALVSLNEMFTSKSKHNRLAITFDDGLINNLRHALPVLESEKVQATFFITTSWLLGESTLWPDALSVLLSKVPHQVRYGGVNYKRTSAIHFRNELTGELIQHVLLHESPAAIEKFIEELKVTTGCNPSQMKELEDAIRVTVGEEIKLLSQSEYVTIGSHAVSHHNMTLMSDEAVMRELIDSKKYLEHATGKAVNSIAYPFGLYTRTMLNVAQHAGYTQQFAVNYLHDEDQPDVRVMNRIGLYCDRSFVEQMHLVNLF
ncbi:MAG: polysaccharide deacetylase family protein [Flavobacteriales bacterium]